ncbi:MotA/TolQ/ExbB proton channel family protein [Yeosuana marina]|uniref:MotA/TolQ/ExbB proton channel family protein n=1 Tax=Yeosuana marina TaxID=1565536 RepID=UPI0030C81268
MRMPFTEFITNGDLKFIIVFVIFSATAIVHFVKKLKSKNSPEYQKLVKYHNSKIDIAAFWILISGILSLLLGLMHSFYFIGKAGGIAPNLIFQGISTALITPVLGVALFMICKILKGTFNSLKQNA